MSRAMILFFSVSISSLSACEQPASTKVSPPKEPPPAGEVAEEIPSAQHDPAQLAGRATPVVREGGKELSKRWIVILDGAGDEKKRQDRLRKLGELEMERDPRALRSTHFNKLMPCYDVLIANHFAKREEAVAYSKALTAAGVGNYPKYAGRYVGPLPRVEKVCARGPSSEDACKNDLRFAASHNGVSYEHLALAPHIEKRALKRAAKPKLVADDAWIAAMPQVQLGDTKVGDARFVLDEKGRVTACKVKGFAALSRARAFDFVMKMGPESCGTLAVYAALDCVVERPILSSSKPITVARTIKKEAKVTAGTDTSGGVFRKHKEAAQKYAEEHKERVKMRESATRFELAGQSLEAVDVEVYTGEGFNAGCGGDFVARSRAWSTIDGDRATPLSPLVDAESRFVVQVIEVDGVRYEVFEENFGDLGLIRLDATEAECRLPMAYCACPC